MLKAKNYLFFRVESKATITPNIVESAECMVDLIMKLARKCKVFNMPIYYHSNKRIQLNLNESKAELSKLVATQILNKEWNEITKFEGNKKPTLEYRREIGKGFSGWFSFVDEKENTLFDCSIGIGYKVNGIVISPRNKDILFEYSWYEEVFKILIEAIQAQYGSIRVSHPSINDIYKEYDLQYPLGWLTYYSKELDITIPDLSSVNVEPYQNGVLIKTDEIDFLANKESFAEYKLRLIMLLKRFKGANDKLNLL